MYWKDELKNRGLITTGFHLPYNPTLVSRAKEMRKYMTDAEKKFWQEYLRNFKYRVLRQRPIDHYIVDFYCAKLRLVIEVDGGVHENKNQKKYDEQRTRFLNAYGLGLTVIRFRNEEVINEFEKVCKKIESFL